MFCKYCGNPIDKNTTFCSACGKPVYREQPGVNSRPPQRKGKYRRKRKSPLVPILCVIGAVALCVGVFFLGKSLLASDEGDSNIDAISIVQNGYLGEYTDITVKEILDGYYGMLYEKDEWDSGTTDSGSVIVQAKYYDEGMDDNAATIQFTMLNEECFKITALVDPLSPVEKPTDLLAVMNYNYLLAYMGENRDLAGDAAAEKAFITKLDQVSGSAVQYGASATYSGDRASICELDGKAPLDVSAAMLLDSYGLLDMSYYWEDEPPEQTTETETTAPAVDPTEATEYDADELLLAVLKGEATFIMSDTYEDITIHDVTKVSYDEFDAPLIPILYAYADMDQDGQREAIVELTNNVDGWRIILRYQDGAVYGYGYHYRALQSISIDGLAMASSGADYSDIFRLRFDLDGAHEEYLSSVESETALDQWVEVSWYDYSELDSASAGDPAGTYPLDFIGGDTGDVVNALGEKYIYEDGFAGSKLFYYGSEPDVHYGFIPLSWEDPVITGSEAITIILLSGDAQINSYLSADMNKAEIDAVAWDTPNVQNVEGGSSNDMMSGNIYRYEIETATAIITYTWYLDNGDSIDYAASEIVIVPK